MLESAIAPLVMLGNTVMASCARPALIPVAALVIGNPALLGTSEQLMIAEAGRLDGFSGCLERKPA